MTEYLVVTFALVVLCGCAIVAYTGIDAMERDEEERARWARRRRPLGPVVAKPVPPRVAPPEVRVQFASVTAHVDWLEGRIRVAEEQLDQLVRDSQRASRA